MQPIQFNAWTCLPWTFKGPLEQFWQKALRDARIIYTDLSKNQSQANSAYYHRQDGYQPSVADWGGGVFASCSAGPTANGRQQIALWDN